MSEIDSGSTRHRGRRRERYYSANDGTECDPESCLHATYLKRSKIDISENLRFLRDSVGRARRLFYR